MTEAMGLYRLPQAQLGQPARLAIDVVNL